MSIREGFRHSPVCIKFFNSEFILTFVLLYLQTVLFCRRFHFHFQVLRPNVEESGTVRKSAKPNILFFELPEQIFVRYFYFCCLFVPEMKEIYPFFYYASTMAEKRGASSSQKQQVQVYPKIELLPTAESTTRKFSYIEEITTVTKSFS